MSNLEDHLAEQDATTAASEAASVDFTWSAAAFAIMARTAQTGDDNTRRAAPALAVDADLKAALQREE